MSKWIFNKSGSEKTYRGLSFPDDTYTHIPAWAESLIAIDDTVLSDITSGNIEISLDGTTSLIGNANQIAALNNSLPTKVEATNTPFASKTLPDGKKLFRRVHGFSGTVSDSTVNIDFTVPYAACKITGVQVIGGALGDTANFKVLDSSSGIISTVPYYQLNQFAYDINILPDVADYPSKYDADLISGLVLRIEYTPVDVGSRYIYVNVDLHQVVDP